MWQTLIDMRGEAARTLTASLYSCRSMTVDHGRDERLPLTVVDERVAVALQVVQ